MEYYKDIFLASCVIVILLFVLVYVVDLIVYLIARVFGARNVNTSNICRRNTHTDPYKLQLVPLGYYNKTTHVEVPIHQRKQITPPERPRTVPAFSADVLAKRHFLDEPLDRRTRRLPRLRNQVYDETTSSDKMKGQLVLSKARQTANYSPFLAACWNCDLWKIQTLIKRGADPREKTTAGETGLLLATYRMAKGVKPWDPRCLELLLENGCPINELTNGRNTALHVAVKAEHLPSVKWLVENGASVRVANKQGWRPMAIAKAQGRTDIADLLWKKYFEDENGRPEEKESSDYQCAWACAYCDSK